jgi:hypothetical protein
MRSTTIAAMLGVATVCLVTTAAQADSEVAGMLRGSYADSDGGPQVWGGGGAVKVRFDESWGLQASGTYHDVTGIGSNAWSAGGSAFWQDDDIRVALNGMYHNAFGSGFASYGGGIEWLASEEFTLAARGGGLSGSGFSGGYAGGEVNWFIFPTIGVSAGVDWMESGGSSITTENVQAEWLVSNDWPLSLYGGYRHIDAPFGVDGNMFFVGIKLYAGGDGARDLIAHRHDTLGYIGESPIFLDQL